MDTVIRRTVDCPCGNNLYTKEVNDALQPVWRCGNCFAETPRKRVSRRTNKHRALRSYLAIREAWKATDEALDLLAKAGHIKGGAVLVHSSMFNWHLKQLVDKHKLSNFEVRYHTANAKLELAKAQAFVQEAQDRAKELDSERA